MMPTSPKNAFFSSLPWTYFIIFTTWMVFTHSTDQTIPPTSNCSSTPVELLNPSQTTPRDTLLPLKTHTHQPKWTKLDLWPELDDEFMNELYQEIAHRWEKNSTNSMSHQRVKRQLSNTPVLVKLQAFIFEVQVKRLDSPAEARNHLRKLMAAYPHLMLDPSYVEEMIIGYNPLVMQVEVCQEFDRSRSDEHVANTFFIVNDVGTFVPRPLHDRLHRLLFQITSALGIPSITWLPNRVGQFELDESQLAVRLEPLTWHVSHALVDFMYAYNWNMVIIVYNNMVSGSKILVEEMRKRHTERSMPDHAKYFDYDLNTLLYIADNLKNTKYDYLNELFDEHYVWIFTPSTMSSLTVADSQENTSMDNQVLKESTMFRRIPGMFGLICLNDMERRRKSAELARVIWQKALIELTHQLSKIYPPQAGVQLDMNQPTTVAYFRQILEKIKPQQLCHDSEHMVWQWGCRMFDIMRSLNFEFHGEPISFLPNGGLNVSSMYVYNSRTTSGSMDWHKVGTWSMSSRWGRIKSRLRIDGVTWPGGSNSPPKGRPSKFTLRVVTIKEKPFVIYQKRQDDGKCDANSLPCRLRAQSMAELSLPLTDGLLTTPGGSSGTSQSTQPSMNSTAEKNETQYVNGCCTGLTMDLLMELMKDLNFDVDLFEVPDGLWGAWAPDGWNGIIRSLINNEADMAVTSLKITPNRSQQVHFSVPFLQTGIAVEVALREGAISPTAFLKPYDYQSWCFILVFSVHASGAALFIFEWLSPNGLDQGQNKPTDYRFSLFRSLWLIWSMLFGAAVNADNPRGVASRFLANIWALFALVFLASYTANLAAFMIAKEDYYDLSGMNDWRLQQPWNVKPPFRFATIPSGATEENIKINFPEMSAYMVKFNRSTVEEGLKALKVGELDAFIYDANVLDYWASKDEGCKLRIVGNLYAMTGYGIAFAKDNRWLEKVNSRILDYQKNGKLQRWKKFWQTGSCRRDSALGNTNKTLGVKNFISAFILLLCGILICSLILAAEHIVHRFCRSRLKRCLENNCHNDEQTEFERHPQEKTNTTFDPHQCPSQSPEFEAQNHDSPDKQLERLKGENLSLQERLKHMEVMFAQLRVKQTDIGFDDFNSNQQHTIPPNNSTEMDDQSFHQAGAERGRMTGAPLNGKMTHRPRSRGRSDRKQPDRPNETGSRIGAEHSKLWDIYSKVAVIPIEPQASVYYSCRHPDETESGPMREEDDEQDAPHAIILPRLTSSPSRRRRGRDPFLAESLPVNITTNSSPFDRDHTRVGQGQMHLLDDERSFLMESNPRIESGKPKMKRAKKQQREIRFLHTDPNAPDAIADSRSRPASRNSRQSTRFEGNDFQAKMEKESVL